MKNICLLLLAITLVSCSERKVYRIGVSQCSEDIWREKQNQELVMGTYFYDNAKLEFASADDDDQMQISQINHFIDEDVDLLIVSPNQVNTISSAIDRAYDKGIPVILFDRKTDSEKYTAFMGADNLEMGSMIGKFIDGRRGSGMVLEIKGLKGSSPAQERHEGFVKGFADEGRLLTCDGDWTQKSGYRLMDSVLQQRQDIVCVFGQNDRMAVGAYEAAKKRGLEKKMIFVGIDALPTKDGGIEQVMNGVLTASYIYPTRGDLLMKLAMSILEGKPYDKENLLKSALVTHDNAEVMLMQTAFDAARKGGLVSAAVPSPEGVPAADGDYRAAGNRTAVVPHSGHAPPTPDGARDICVGGGLADGNPLRPAEGRATGG